MVKRAARGPRLRPGEAIFGASAAVLFVTMFIPWYGVKVSGQVRTLEFIDTSVGRTAWQTLDVVSLFLVLAIAAALGVVLLRVLGSGWKPVIAPGAAVTVLGGLAVLLILFRIVVPPSLDIGGLALEVTPSLGAFIGLAAALGIAYGGYRAMGEEGISFAKVADNLAPRKPRKSAAKKS
ncbi:MAG: hypothetical protein JJE35_14625 [Thermoleophilia bacterium]|nr:hypothetical protein [Thermoleophilia bacterium]